MRAPPDRIPRIPDAGCSAGSPATPISHDLAAGDIPIQAGGPTIARAVDRPGSRSDIAAPLDRLARVSGCSTHHSRADGRKLHLLAETGLRAHRHSHPRPAAAHTL